MNLRSVESFYWVVMLRSVSRAADKLHLTQSAMSSRIAMVEQELGAPLLDRRDRQQCDRGLGVDALEVFGGQVLPVSA